MRWTWLEASNYVEPVRAAVGVKLQHVDREPDFRFAKRVAKIAGHHAEDRDGLRHQGQRAAGNGGVRVEAALPKRVADEAYEVVLNLFIAGAKAAADCGLHAEHVKK